MTEPDDDPRRRNARTIDGVDGWTISGTDNDMVVLRDATNLLRAELPDPRLEDDTAYVKWCYRDNPLGRAWERYHYVEDGDDPLLVAHYLNIPRRYRGPGGERSDGAWSQHAVTLTGHQRARHFSRLGLEIFNEAGSQGRSFVIGVTNDNSTPAVVKYMGFRLVGPLPVRVISAVGRGRRRVTHAEVTDAWLDSSDFDDFAGMVDRHDVAGWSTDWSPDVLRWRLACPFTRYWVHVGDDAAVITTTSNLGPLPATVVLKVFPLVPGSVNATRIIRSITRWHRGAFAVYAGFNQSVRINGIAAPRRLQPSPLNLVLRRLDPEFDQDAVVLDTFEFLDMDAY